jgi:hypothetical protein
MYVTARHQKLTKPTAIRKKRLKGSAAAPLNVHPTQWSSRLKLRGAVLKWPLQERFEADRVSALNGGFPNREADDFMERVHAAFGKMKGTGAFDGDGVAFQRRLRSEWR